MINRKKRKTIAPKEIRKTIESYDAKNEINALNKAINTNTIVKLNCCSF